MSAEDGQTALRHKAEAYDRIARILRVGESEANRDRIVHLVKVAAEVRDEAMRTRDEAVLLAAAAEARGYAAAVADVVAWLRTAPEAGPIGASQYLARAATQIQDGAHVGAAKKGGSNV